MGKTMTLQEDLLPADDQKYRALSKVIREEIFIEYNKEYARAWLPLKSVCAWLLPIEEDLVLDSIFRYFEGISVNLLEDKLKSRIARRVDRDTGYTLDREGKDYSQVLATMCLGDKPMFLPSGDLNHIVGVLN